MHLYSGYSDGRMVLCQENGDDAGSSSGFKYPVTGLYTAEVREEEAVQREAMAFFLLGDTYDVRTAEGDAVMGE